MTSLASTRMSIPFFRYPHLFEQQRDEILRAVTATTTMLKSMVNSIRRVGPDIIQPTAKLIKERANSDFTTSTS